MRVLIDRVGQVQGYLSLQQFLVAAGLIGPKHKVIGADEAPVKLAIGQHVLLANVLSVIRLHKIDEVIAAGGWTLTRVDVLVVVTTTARDYLHVLVGGVGPLQNDHASAAHT